MGGRTRRMTPVKTSITSTQSPAARFEAVSGMIARGEIDAADARRLLDMGEMPLDAGAQKFFAELYTESRRPSYGDHSREFIRQILLRAEERGLYVPPLNP